jgi:HD-GYP domain-containing protein (c-di-GMP phosphodiesterase class II)
MQFEMLLMGILSGGMLGGAGLGSFYFQKLQKQIRKQSLQLKTIEQLYNEVQRASKTIDSTVISSIEAFVQALEARDSYTRGHSDRVNRYSMAMGRLMGLSESELKVLHDSSLLHDIGKIGIPDGILLKPARLNEEERTMMNSHPVLSADILKSVPFLQEHIPVILHHHEQQDGSGYPFGLKDDEIPMMARIVQVADTWDAMRSDRPYRRRLPLEVATAELKKVSGKQLDTQCVEAFLTWVHSRQPSATTT